MAALQKKRTLAHQAIEKCLEYEDPRTRQLPLCLACELARTKVAELAAGKDSDEKIRAIVEGRTEEGFRNGLTPQKFAHSPAQSAVGSRMNRRGALLNARPLTTW